MNLVFLILGLFLFIKPIYFYSKGFVFQEIAKIYWNSNNHKLCIESMDKILVGKLTIPVIDFDNVVLSGTDNATLSVGPGLVEKDFLINNNNIIIAAHRDSFFKKIKNINLDDIIIFEDNSNNDKYKVIDILSNVEPYEMSYFDSDNNDLLILITCFPFDFIGPAPYRYLVIAEKNI